MAGLRSDRSPESSGCSASWFHQCAFFLLPAYRGSAPINWAIINGERETGVTIMQVDVEMDSGPIVLQQPEPIAPDDTAAALHDRLAVLGGRLLGQALDQLAGPGLAAGCAAARAATYAPMLSKADGSD